MFSKTINFFEQITKIPRESGNEKEIAHFLVQFAKDRNLPYYIDEYYNVFIHKKTIDVEPLILQCHTDMVCEKEVGKKFDFKTDSIPIKNDGQFIYANGTTLGADNGIGIAQILNVLDSDYDCNIEALFTSCEETTMSGAMNFDVSLLKGKNLLNLDGFNENTIIHESASFHDILVHLDFDFENRSFNGYKLTLSGLEGGHSGFDIDKNKGNSLKLIVELLKSFRDVKLSLLNGGTKFNVIPSMAMSCFSTSDSKIEIELKIKRFLQKYKSFYPNLDIQFDDYKITKIINDLNTTKLLNYLNDFKHGVIYRESNIPTTSLNLAVVDLENKLIKIGMRSSRENEDMEIKNYLMKEAQSFHYRFEEIGYQPGFFTEPNHSFIQLLEEAFLLEKSLLNVESVHITVEPGIFKNKMNFLNIAIISPNIVGAHTVKERVEIQSVLRTDQWLFHFIKLYNLYYLKK